jgi:hypothetical protein
MTKKFDPQLMGKNLHTYDIIRGLFRLTTRCCNLMGVWDPIKETNYEQHHSKKMSFLIGNDLKKKQEMKHSRFMKWNNCIN